MMPGHQTFLMTTTTSLSWTISQKCFLFNTNEREEDIEKIDYQGKSLSGNDTIQERIDGGYITRGFTAKVWFNGEQFDISFSASEMMGYAKVENINDYNEASELMNKIRKKYMKHLREY
jgi:hypothetical protein